MTQTVRRPVEAPQAPAAFRQPGLVAVLRLAALECRAAPRGSLTACALLEPGAGAEDYAVALARCLSQMLVRRPVLHRPGTASRSFDEEWLVALSRALGEGDRASARFLARSRARPEAVPYLLLLVTGLAERVYDPA